MIQLVFLLECLVAHLEENLVLELGASTLYVVNPPPNLFIYFVMRLNTIRLHCHGI